MKKLNKPTPHSAGGGGLKQKKMNVTFTTLEKSKQIGQPLIEIEMSGTVLGETGDEYMILCSDLMTRQIHKSRVKIQDHGN